MDGVQLLQGYRATMRRQFTLYHLVPRDSWYSFDQPRKDERLSQPWSHPVVLNSGPLDWEYSTLPTRPCSIMPCVLFFNKTKHIIKSTSIELCDKNCDSSNFMYQRVTDDPIY